MSPTTPIAPTASPAWSKIGAASRLAEHGLVALARQAGLAHGRRAPCAARAAVSVRLVSFGERLGDQVVEDLPAR